MTYDAIIIGSGAGGSAVAYRLVKAGKRVLMIEKGQALPIDGSTLDVRRVIQEGHFKSRESWLDGCNRPFIPEEYFNVGGKTKWYGAALLRFAPEAFETDLAIQCLGWPITYRDLEPYYSEAEQLLDVRPFAIEADLKAIRVRVDKQGSGWYVRPLPLALAPGILDDDDEAGHFDGFASVKGYKADAQNSLLEPIVGQPNFTLMTGRPVTRLLGEGRALTGVETSSGGQFTADKIVLAAGALHSPRLLEAYVADNERTLNPANRTLIGAYFKRHLLTALVVLSPGTKTDRLRKTTLWLNDEFPHSSVQPLGFGGDVLASLVPAFVPRSIARWIGRRAYGFFLQTEDGSDISNRISTTTAPDGSMVPRLDYDPKRFPTLSHEHRDMVKSFRKQLQKAGHFCFLKPIPLAGTAHACGTLVTGNDPAESVVDGYGKVHGLDHLYVADGSILPRSSRVNPALTIYAWGLRTADHLLEGIS